MMSISGLPRLFAALAVTICAPLSTATPALAQRADAGWHPAPLTAPTWIAPPSIGPAAPASAIAADSTRIPRTYWFEGAALLGSVSGVLGAVMGVDLCGYDQDCRRPVLAALEGLLIVGVVGFGVGAMIGGQFPKS
jgi:hypothetical protein